jgi:hypothetical protein
LRGPDDSRRGACWLGSQASSIQKGIPSAEDYKSLGDILQLTNIAWPRIGLAQPERIFVDLADLLARHLRVVLHEVLDQHRNVFLAVPKRRHVDGENIQPVEEVGAKCS